MTVSVKILAGVSLGLTLLGTVYGLQLQRRNQMYEREMQNPADDPPDAYEEGEFAFARLRYRSFRGGFFRGGSWGTDSNKAERQFIQGVRRLSRLNTRSVEEIIDIDSDEMYNWPWLYAVEVGHWSLNETQARRLREYLDRGGFLVVDDFHGQYEWSVFMAGLRQVFPDRQVVELDDSEPIFHVLYDLKERFQVPGRQYIGSGLTYERYDGVEPHWRGVLDEEGRVQVAILFNMDHGDAWEWADDPYYPEPFAALAYRIGLNYILYPMTH